MGAARFSGYLALVVGIASKQAVADDVTVRVRSQTGNVWTKDHLAPFEIQVEGTERIRAQLPRQLVHYSCSVKTPEGRLVQTFIGYPKSDDYMPMEVMLSRGVLQAFGEARSSGNLTIDCEVRWSELSPIVLGKVGPHATVGQYVPRPRTTRASFTVAAPQTIWAPETSLASIAWVPCVGTACVDPSIEIELKRNLPPGYNEPRTIRCGVQSLLPKAQASYFVAPFVEAGTWEAGASDNKHRFVMTMLPKIESPEKRVVCTMVGNALEPYWTREVVLQTPVSAVIPRAFSDLEIKSIGAMGTRVLGKPGCTRCDYGIPSAPATRSFELKILLRNLIGPASVSATCTSPLGNFAGAAGATPSQSTEGAVSLRMTGALDSVFDGGDMLSPRTPLDSQKLSERTPTNVRCVARAIPPFTESKPVEGTVQWGPWTPAQ